VTIVAVAEGKVYVIVNLLLVKNINNDKKNTNDKVFP